MGTWCIRLFFAALSLSIVCSSGIVSDKKSSNCIKQFSNCTRKMGLKHTLWRFKLSVSPVWVKKYKKWQSRVELCSIEVPLFLRSLFGIKIYMSRSRIHNITLTLHSLFTVLWCILFSLRVTKVTI